MNSISLEKPARGKVGKFVNLALTKGPVLALDEVRCYWLSREIRRFEARYDLELANLTELADLTIEQSTKQHGYPYGPSPPQVMKVVLENFGPDFSKTTFIDLGSGKGLPMLMASHFNFQAIVGVEFAQELHDAAVENLRKYRSPERVCHNVTAIHADVMDYEFPETDLLVYLCNPFNEKILRSIVQKLIETRERTGKSISVVYQQMKREDGSTRAARVVRGTFEETGRLVPRKFKIRRLIDRLVLSHLTFIAFDFQ